MVKCTAKRKINERRWKRGEREIKFVAESKVKERRRERENWRVEFA